MLNNKPAKRGVSLFALWMIALALLFALGVCLLALGLANDLPYQYNV